jgi:hypothetical protein
VLLGRTADAVVRVLAPVGLAALGFALVPLALAPLGRMDAADAPDPVEADWLGGGLPVGRFGGGVPARCWRRRLVLLTWLPR